MQDHYQVLKINRNATADEIKKSYRRLAKTMHPDLHPSETEYYTKKMSEITIAWAILGNARNKLHYDRELQEYASKPKSQDDAPKSEKKTSNPTSPSKEDVAEDVNIYNIPTDQLKNINIFKILFGKQYAHVGIPTTYMFTDLHREKRARKVPTSWIFSIFGRLFDVLHSWFWWLFSFNKFTAMRRMMYLIGILIITNIPMTDTSILASIYLKTSTITSNLIVMSIGLRVVYILAVKVYKGVKKLGRFFAPKKRL